MSHRRLTGSAPGQTAMLLLEVPRSLSAATGGAAAGLADIARTGRTHLDPAGQAERRVGRSALLGLDELRRGPGLGRPRLVGRVLTRNVLDRNAVAQRLRVQLLLRRRRSRGGAAIVLRDGRGPLLGGEDAELGPLLVRQVVQREPTEDVVHH